MCQATVLPVDRITQPGEIPTTRFGLPSPPNRMDRVGPRTATRFMTCVCAEDIIGKGMRRTSITLNSVSHGFERGWGLKHEGLKIARAITLYPTGPVGSEQGGVV